VPVFRIAVLGAFLHSLLLVIIIVALYFDFKPLAMTVCLVFFLSNGLFTFLTTQLAVPFLGYGYLASCLVSLVFAYYALNSKLKRLEFLTFAPQPIGVHREEEIW